MRLGKLSASCRSYSIKVKLPFTYVNTADFGHHFKRGRAEHVGAYRKTTDSWWEVWGGVLVPSQTLMPRQRKKEDAFYSLQIFFCRSFFFLKAADQPNNSINNNKTEMCHTVENVITT